LAALPLFWLLTQANSTVVVMQAPVESGHVFVVMSGLLRQDDLGDLPKMLDEFVRRHKVALAEHEFRGSAGSAEA